MRFTVSSSSFSSKLNICKVCMNNKNTLPILDGVLLAVSGNTLSIVASNSEREVKMTMPLTEPGEDGSAVILFKSLEKAFKNLGDQPITVTVDESTHAVEIAYNRGKANIMAMDAADFPLMSEVNGTTSITIDTTMLCDAVNRCAYAVASDELRPQMECIYMDIKPDKITFVASDGHKLIRSVRTDVMPGQDYSVSLRSSIITCIKSMFSKAEASDVVICNDARNVSISNEEYKLTFRTLEGRYPNYNSVIPNSHAFIAHVDKESLIGALRRVTAFAPEATSLVSLNFSEGMLNVKVNDVDFSCSSEESIDIDYNASPLRIGMNGNFLIESVTKIPGDTIVMGFDRPETCLTCQPIEQGESENVLTLLMPLMLND